MVSFVFSLFLPDNATVSVADPHHFDSDQSPNFSTFKEPKNRFQGINSANICSLASGGPVGQPYSYSFPNPHRLFTNSSSISCLSLTVDADPHPTFHFDADPDPDPTLHFDADPVTDPDPSFQIKAQNLEKCSNRLLIYTF